MSITKWILSAVCAVLIAAPAFAAPPAIPPGAPFNNVNSIPNVYNFTPTSLPRYRAKLARALSGGAPVSIAFWGDSTTMGLGSGSGGISNVNGAKVNSFPTQVGNLFTKAGFNVAQDSTWGTNGAGNPAAPYPYDPKWSFAGASWSQNFITLGGSLWINASGTDIASYTPAASTDKIDVYYWDGAVSSFTVKDGATLLGTVSMTGTNSFIKVSYSRTASTNAINIARASGGSIWIGAVDTWNSMTAQVKIMNMGGSGDSSNAYSNTTFTFGPISAIGTVNPDVVLIDLDINDIRTNVAVATHQSQLQAMITQLKANGSDIILVRSHPDNAPVNPSLIPGYQSADYALAKSNGIPLIDLTARFGSYTVMNAQGNYYDSVHQTAQGYGDIAMALWQVLRPQ